MRVSRAVGVGRGSDLGVGIFILDEEKCVYYISKPTWPLCIPSPKVLETRTTPKKWLRVESFGARLGVLVY